MGQDSVGCVLHVESEVGGKLCIRREGVGRKLMVGCHVICDVSGIAASSVSGAGETCVICYCS